MKLDPIRLLEWNKRMENANLWGSHEWDSHFLAVITGRLDKLNCNNLKTKDALSALDHRGATLLHYAAYLGHYEIVEALLKAGADIDGNEKQKLPTPLGQAIIAGDFKIFSFLLDKGANINISDDNDISPLMTAAIAGKLEIVKLLIEKGADISGLTVSSSKKLAFLVLAAIKGHSEVVQFLLDNGAKK